MDVIGIQLKADKVHGCYILNGIKLWTNNAAYADPPVGYAKISDVSGGVTAFLIEKNVAGFAIGWKIDKLAMRGSPTAELVFTDCEVSDENLIGPVMAGSAC